MPDREPIYPRDYATRGVSGNIDTGPYEYGSTTPLIPLPVEGLTATAQSSTSVRLQWSNLCDTEDGFAIMRLSDNTVGWEEIGTASVGATSYLDSGCSSGKAYCYNVIAYNSYGDGAHSNAAKVTTP